MSRSESETPDDPLANALAAYDDRLAAGVTPLSDDLEQSVDPNLVPDLHRLTAFLSLVEKAWPRGVDHEEPTIAESQLLAKAPVLDESTEAAEKAARESSPQGQQFGRFEILGTLGRGGFGIVFLAWDPTLRRRIALKVPQPESLMTPEARKRFQREAHAAAGLDHSNIVPVYESGSVGTISYIAAAYVEGPTLAHWLSIQKRPVPSEDAARLVSLLARAVAHAHERGVIHRDLKPSNILLQRASSEVKSDSHEDSALGNFEPRITDFSLAKIADGLGPDTKSGVPFGSPQYMAPEQAEGDLTKIGPAADVYALGCILYELLTGRPPFSGQNQLETLRKVINDDPLPPRGMRRELSFALDAIALECLKKDPARRYASASALAEDLDRFLAGEPVKARPPTGFERLHRTVRRHPASLVVFLLLVLFGGLFFVVRTRYQRNLIATRESTRRLQEESRGRKLEARRAQYVADIRQAALYHKELRYIEAEKLLARNLPGPDEEDSRTFAWRHLWLKSHAERRTLKGHIGDVYHVEFSPNGKLLASSGKDGTVLIWETTNWRLTQTIEVTKSEVNACAFSPDGQTLATVDDEGKFKLWDLATGR